MAEQPQAESVDPAERRDSIIADLAAMMAAFQVPASLGRPALEPVAIPWRRLHRELHTFGWAKKEDYERELREVLGL